MYFIAVRHAVIDDSPPPPSGKEFARDRFLELLPEFFIPLAILTALSVSFLHRVRFRLDEIEPYLTTRVLPETPNEESKRANAQVGVYSSKQKMQMNLLAGLFLSHGRTAANLRYRRHLFWMGLAIRVLICMPVPLVIMWGAVCVQQVTPQ